MHDAHGPCRPSANDTESAAVLMAQPRNIDVEARDGVSFGGVELRRGPLATKPEAGERQQTSSAATTALAMGASGGASDFGHGE